MAYPNLQNINLPTCCLRSIETINRRIQSNNYLQPFLCLGTLLNIFGPSPSKLNTIVSVQQTDFIALSESVKAVPQITRNLIVQDCQLEQLKHTGNRKLSQFWEGLVDAFR